MHLLIAIPKSYCLTPELHLRIRIVFYIHTFALCIHPFYLNDLLPYAYAFASFPLLQRTCCFRSHCSCSSSASTAPRMHFALFCLLCNFAILLPFSFCNVIDTHCMHSVSSIVITHSSFSSTSHLARIRIPHISHLIHSRLDLFSFFFRFVARLDERTDVHLEPVVRVASQCQSRFGNRNMGAIRVKPEKRSVKGCHSFLLIRIQVWAWKNLY